MNMKVTGAIAGIAVLFPALAFAGPIIRTGESISVDASQVLKGDFYALGSTVTISGAGDNDVYIAGGNVTVNAPIVEDLTVAGGSVQVHGDVGDDVRVVGGEVTIAKAVKGDVVVLGGTLTILSTAQIEGSVLFMGGELTVEGNVVGEVHGTADRVRINAEIGGDILMNAKSSFTLGERANVLGTITYGGATDLVRAQDAQVRGDIQKMAAPAENDSGFLKFFILELCILLFAALSLFLIARSRVQTLVELAGANPGKSGLVGLGVFLILPFIGGMLMVSVLGILIGVVVLTLYVSILLVSLALGGVLVGQWLQKWLTRKSALSFSTVLLGVLLFAALGFIPYVGGLIMLGLVIVALGAVAQSIYRVIQP